VPPTKAPNPTNKCKLNNNLFDRFISSPPYLIHYFFSIKNILTSKQTYK
jgi:hypothetical protein